MLPRTWFSELFGVTRVLKGGPFFKGLFFFIFLKVFFCFSGRVAFRFVWLLWLLWLFISHPLHSQFLSFRILCIASSAAAGGFLALWLLAAFWRFASSAFPVGFWLGFLHPQHRKFLSGAPHHPPSIKMHTELNHHFFDHYSAATF